MKIESYDGLKEKWRKHIFSKAKNNGGEKCLRFNITQGLCLIFQLKLGNDCISNAKKLCVKLENVKDVLKKLAEKTYCLARISTKMNQLTHNLIRKNTLIFTFWMCTSD